MLTLTGGRIVLQQLYEKSIKICDTKNVMHNIYMNFIALTLTVKATKCYKHFVVGLYRLFVNGGYREATRLN